MKDMEILAHHQRELDPIERSYLVRLLFGLYQNFAVSIKLNKPTNKIVLSNALKLMLARNPTLCVNAFRSKGTAEGDKQLNYKNFALRPVSHVHFEDVVTYHKGTIDSETLLDISVQECHVITDFPVWRVRVYDSDDGQYICFLNNHLLLDGQSSGHFLTELVASLAEVEENNLNYEPVIFDYESQKQHLPALALPCSLLCDLYTGTWYERAAVVLSEILPSSILDYWNAFYSFMPDVFRYPVYVNERQRRADYKCFKYNIPAEQTEKLVRLCRDKGITLTPLLDVISKYCLQETLLKNHLASNASVGSCIPISARRFYPELHADLKYSFCVFASFPILAPIQDPSPENLLQVAKQVAECIKTDVESRYVSKKFEFFKWINLYNYYSPEEPTIRDKGTFEVSNIGALRIRYGHWEATDAIFGACVGLRPSINYCVAATPKGGLNVAGNFVSALDTELPSSEIDRFNQLLGEATLAPGSVYSEAHERLFYLKVAQLIAY